MKLISPIAPHIAEELWEKSRSYRQQLRMKHGQHLMKSKLVDDEVEIPVQIKGKVRAKLLVSKDATKEELEALALSF